MSTLVTQFNCTPCSDDEDCVRYKDDKIKLVMAKGERDTLMKIERIRANEDEVLAKKLCYSSKEERDAAMAIREKEWGDILSAIKVDFYHHKRQCNVLLDPLGVDVPTEELLKPPAERLKLPPPVLPAKPSASSLASPTALPSALPKALKTRVQEIPPTGLLDTVVLLTSGLGERPVVDYDDTKPSVGSKKLREVLKTATTGSQIELVNQDGKRTIMNCRERTEQMVNEKGIIKFKLERALVSDGEDNRPKEEHEADEQMERIQQLFDQDPQMAMDCVRSRLIELFRLKERENWPIILLAFYFYSNAIDLENQICLKI